MKEVIAYFANLRQTVHALGSALIALTLVAYDIAEGHCFFSMSA